MSGALDVLSVGPGVSLQDLGRPGYLAQGLSRGGAADTLALAEGAALLQQPLTTAIEMGGFGGRFRATRDLRIALSGATMRVTLDGAPLAWASSHVMPAGALLEIGGALEGVYGYLTVGGGFDTPRLLGAQGAHLAAGLGRALQEGDTLALGPDSGTAVGMELDVAPRFSGGLLRVLPSLQTDLFSEETRARFEQEAFTRDTRGNRMGLRLLPSGAGFSLEGGQSILSEVIAPGDIQIPGDGAPYILMSECQTTGGYPRMGTVIPADLPRVAQAAPGAEIRFAFVTRAQALAAEASDRSARAQLAARVRPRIRDLWRMTDLLSYTLISGVTDGKDNA